MKNLLFVIISGALATTLITPTLFNHHGHLAFSEEQVSLPSSPEPYEHFPCFDECRYNLSFENQTYSISYRLWGEPYGNAEGIKVEDIYADRTAKTVTVDVSSQNQNGTLVLSLSPRLSGALDYQTISFFVDDKKLVPGKEVLIDRYTYLLDFPKGTDKIRFVGVKEAGINDEINKSFTLNATSVVTDASENKKEMITSYDIIYNITNGRLENVQLEKYMPIENAYDGVLIIEFTPVGYGNISLQFPRELLDKIAPINKLEVMTYDGIGDPREKVTCEYRTVIVDFDKWTEAPLEIYGMYLDGIESREFANDEAILLVNSPREDPFPFVRATNNTDICGWEFSAKDKRLDIYVKEDSTQLNVSMPEKVLGGPYTIFAMDSKNKTKIEDFTQSTENVTYFRSGENRVVEYHDFTVSYSNGTNAIAIIGTTAVPEFGSSIVFTVTAATIGSILILARQQHFRLQK